MHRSTVWRHKTGRSKKVFPHGVVDYYAVGVYLLRRYHPHMFFAYKPDMLQECRVLEMEAKKKCIWIRSQQRLYGNGRDQIGLKLFSRAASARFSEVARKYGYHRPRGSKAYIPRPAWSWGLKDDWIIETPEFEFLDLVIFQVKKIAGETLYKRAMAGDVSAIAKIKTLIF